MPIYEYQCEKCGEIIEAFQNFSDKPLKKCDHCSGKLHKIISQSTFHLKGTGWYVTDYAGKKRDTEKPQSQKQASTADAGDAKTATAEKKSSPKDDT